MSKSTCKIIHIFILFILLNTAASCSRKCTTIKDQDYYSHLATKTPYRFIENRSITPLYYPGCEPQAIWMVIRHGTRNPGSKYIKALDRLVEIQNAFNVNAAKSALCSEDITNLKSWLPPTNLAGREKFLTHEGELEMVGLSWRMQKRLPELFPELYSNASYQFKYTKNQRAELSAKSFVKGLFGSNSKNVWFLEAMHKDPILRFYKCCDKWRLEIDKNPETIKEKKKYLETSYTLSMIENITGRLGLPKNYLNFDDIYFMYSYCAFEIAWNKQKVGAWCSAFTTSDFIILEYAEDLEYFWIDGYGHNLTYRQACVAIKDMLQHFRNSNGAPASFYFTHSGTLLKLLAHLGLYRDTKPLTHEIQNKRLWKVSKIDAFGSNIAFVKYSCYAEKKPFLVLLHQEQPVNIPGCPKDNILCPMETFIDLHHDNQETCDFAGMCRISKENVCKYSLTWLLDQLYKCPF